MSYQVYWVSEAEEELAAIWLESEDRGSITAASHVIDTILRLNPETAGESREEGRRILLEYPLGVSYIISISDQIVSVLTVWRFEKRRRGLS
jgi:hypothetical protein